MKRKLLQFALSLLLLPALPLWAQNECGTLQNLNALNAADTLGIVHKNACWDSVAKVLTFPLGSASTTTGLAANVTVPAAGVTFTPVSGATVNFQAPNNDTFQFQANGASGQAFVGLTSGTVTVNGANNQFSFSNSLLSAGAGDNSATAILGSATDIALFDNSAGLTTANMSAQTTATCTNVTGMTWPIVANGHYRLSCMVHVGFVAVSTIQFCIGGPGTPATTGITADGPIGAAGAYGQIVVTNSPNYSTKTNASGAPGVVADAGIHVDATIRNGATASGTALTLQTAANGANAIQVLSNSVCELHQTP